MVTWTRECCLSRPGTVRTSPSSSFAAYSNYLSPRWRLRSARRGAYIGRLRAFRHNSCPKQNYRLWRERSSYPRLCWGLFVQSHSRSSGRKDCDCRRGSVQTHGHSWRIASNCGYSPSLALIPILILILALSLVLNPSYDDNREG